MSVVIGRTVSSNAMLSSSRRLLALDHFRTPYDVSASGASSRLEWLRCGDGGPMLLWPRADLARAGAMMAMLGEPGGPGLRIFARVIPDDVAERALAEWGGNWNRASGVFRTDGERVASLWRSDDGSVFLPFDPDEVCTNYRSERYNAITRRPGARDWRRLAVLTYYHSRRLLPRSTQILGSADTTPGFRRAASFRAGRWRLACTTFWTRSSRWFSRWQANRSLASPPGQPGNRGRSC